MYICTTYKLCMYVQHMIYVYVFGFPSNMYLFLDGNSIPMLSNYRTVTTGPSNDQLSQHIRLVPPDYQYL